MLFVYYVYLTISFINCEIKMIIIVDSRILTVNENQIKYYDCNITILQHYNFNPKT